MLSSPVCPNVACKVKANAVVKYCRSRPVASANGERRQRFRCNHCLKTFSQNVHHFDYRFKSKDPGLSAKIFSAHLAGNTNRRIGRDHHFSEHGIRRRLKRISDWGFDFQAWHMENFKIKEEICMDGLQNFAGTQYDPNYINQAIGRDSLFIYDFNFSPLNRRGRMSPWQQRRMKEIHETEGRYHRAAVRSSTKTLLMRLYARRAHEDKPLVLLSDKHYQYRQCVQIDLKHFNIKHITIAGTACRNFQNILFSVNHADLLIRQDLAAFKRETIAFSKTHAAMCQRFNLFALHKNYMATQFVKKQVRRPLAHRQSPAQFLGITDHILKFHEIFSPEMRMKTKNATDRHEDWRLFKADLLPENCYRSLDY